MKENRIYKAILNELSKDKYKNALDVERLSKKLSRKVSRTLLSDQRKLVYDVLTSEWERCGAISKRSGIKSNIVSIILTQIMDETTLIESKRDGRFNLYRRTK